MPNMCTCASRILTTQLSGLQWAQAPGGALEPRGRCAVRCSWQGDGGAHSRSHRLYTERTLARLRRWRRRLPTPQLLLSVWPCLLNGASTIYGAAGNGWLLCLFQGPLPASTLSSPLVGAWKACVLCTFGTRSGDGRLGGTFEHSAFTIFCRVSPFQFDSHPTYCFLLCCFSFFAFLGLAPHLAISAQWACIHIAVCHLCRMSLHISTPHPDRP